MVSGQGKHLQLGTAKLLLRVPTLQVMDGATLLGSAERLPYGAAALQALARQQLRQRDAAIKASTAASVCEQHAVVAETREEFEAAGDAEAKEYELPDGQSVSIRSEWCDIGLLRQFSLSSWRLTRRAARA